MSEEIKPKKERKFLKALGKIGEVLIQELFFRVGSNLIRKIGGKKTLPSILFLFLSLSLFAQYPNTLNKQRLGFQTTADGLVWRGALSDTASIQPINNQNAWVILDTVNLKFYTFDFTSNVWNLVNGGTSGLTMPFDSITFNTTKNGTVGVGEVEYNDTQGSLIQGLKGGNVTNVIGQQLHQRVNNRTGAPLAKGDVVYLAGSQGNRITVAKGLAVTDAFSANTFGVVAENIADNQSGFIITEGLITGLNTSALTEDSAVYLSPTVAGALTSTKPQAPQHSVYIGVCVKSNNGSGELFVKIRNGQELDELHDVRITSPVDRASLYYKSSEKLWRDTTAALLVSDTASMLANYATKAYADTTGRLYARQDYTTGVTSSTLTWTQSDTLIPGGVTVVQVYRNGQILLPSQYTIPTSTSVVIAASSFKVNDNYTVIFPRGGGAGSGGGSGSLTSISGGTGILVSPDPITTTGTVSADLSVLMELTDTSLLKLSSRLATKLNTSDTASMLSNYNTRINSKLNISDTASMLAPYFRDADTSLLNLTSRFALKLNATDTASLSNRINAKGNGTVTSVATGYGLTGGTITTTGTLLLDSAVVFSRIRDSIVDVAIGNDTIKILKQEYAPATSSVLTWTVTSKFPIQSKSFILVFRNGQLLINTQYNLTDTNKITIVSNSFKLGANYTVVTVSGIGSVGTGVFPNPVYPEAGIAVSTGSAWASSIANNSSNWNVAFNDKITNAQFTGTNTKTLTLTQYDGGTFTPTFTDLQGVTGVTAGTGLTGGTITSTGTVAVDFTTVAPLASPTFTGTVSGITKSMVGLGNVDNTSDANKPVSTATQTALNGKQNTLTNPVTGTGTTNTLPLFTGSSTLGNSVVQQSSNNIGINTTPFASLTLAQGKNIMLDASSNNIPRILFYESNARNENDVQFGAKIQYNSQSDRLEFIMRDSFSADPSGDELAISITRQTGNTTIHKDLTVTGNITEAGNNVLTSADTTSMLLPYLRTADTTNMLSPYFRDADTTNLNLNSRFASKLNLSDTIKLTTFGTSNAATLINKTLNIPNYKTLSVTDPLQDYIVKFSDNIGAGIKRSNIFESGTTVDMASSDVKLGAIKNNGTFSSPITISTNCGSSGSPNLIGTSTGNYVNNCSSGTAYILLPDPADVSGFTVGRILTITNLRSNQSIVLNTSGSYSNARPLGIDGAAESSIAAKRWITVQSNGTNWYIISTGSAL